MVALVPADECEHGALAITALIDGLWLRLGLRSDGLAREDALQQMRDYLACRLPPD
ncbi:hypothetical protein J2857_006230 [Neorhizobium galegae]|uniref:TetR family transcriptional regulator C-terminal domain-containing protein n=1 Tax=Neorhizobium galegae TaxID=399 RepID=UPI001EB971E0|nr:hypothetical protein [Neorhizobium galegae]